VGIQLLVRFLVRSVRVRRERIAVGGRRGFAGDVRHSHDEARSCSGERSDVGEDPDPTTPRSMTPKDRTRPSCSAPPGYMQPPAGEDGSGLIIEGHGALLSRIVYDNV
jgi:hypothetical protein